MPSDSPANLNLDLQRAWPWAVTLLTNTRWQDTLWQTPAAPAAPRCDASSDQAKLAAGEDAAIGAATAG